MTVCNTRKLSDVQVWGLPIAEQAAAAAAAAELLMLPNESCIYSLIS